jgi:pimeloyl-ACP methyl ester carboxylesterase
MERPHSPVPKALHMTSYRRSLPRLILAIALVAPIADVSPFAYTAASAAPTDPSASETSAALAANTEESLSTRCRCWLRRKMVRETDLSCYGLRLDESWQEADEDKSVVLVVHGYNSRPERNEAMLATIRSAGYPCGTFSYPNDYTIAASAQLLSSELRRFHHEHPDRRVTLICHSMGGMVARACVEDTLYDPGNVDRMILIAPPTCGTAIAQFAIGTDVWEHWLSRSDGGPWRRVKDSVVDGLGEAANELCPGSDFLTELNARPRNPNVQYTVILGTGARMTEAELKWVRESVVEKLAKVPGAEGGAQRLDALLSDIDELVEGKGDGVVAVERGRLEGVSDTLVLPFGHLSVTGKAVTGEPGSDVVRQVQAAILERLN